MDVQKLKVALVYDRVNKWGGAERLLLALHRIFPSAPLYTSVYDKKKAPWAGVFQVKTSFLNKFPGLRARHELIPFLMPLAFESFDFSDFDLVISLSSAEAKGIVTKPGTLHICYCLTPTRYLWAFNTDRGYHHFGILEPLAALFKKPFLSLLKSWDEVACHRPDYYLAVSDLVKNRIAKYYGQDSSVLYPPLDPEVISRATSLEKKYFLIVSRLVTYKKIDLAVQVANRLHLPLKIAGRGPEHAYLKQIAGETVQLLGFVPEEDLATLYQGAIAVIVPGQEEFCLSALEAQASGVPVIAYSQSGVAEIIIDGATGVLFDNQNEVDLAHAIEKFSRMVFKADVIRQNAARFSFSAFKSRLTREIEILKRQPMGQP